MLNVEKVLIANGYVKRNITGNYHLIGCEPIKTITDVFVRNINDFLKKPEYLNSFKSPLNKVKIVNEGIEVYTKDNLSVEINGDKIFTYVH